MEERRSALRHGARALSLAAALLSGAAQACELPPGRRVESPNFAIAYATDPAKIEVGAHFAVLYSVCAKTPAANPEQITVDAWMPEHRHGMNYKPSVRALGGGRYRAEGLLFHMPGRWEFVFQAGAERLADSQRVE